MTESTHEAGTPAGPVEVRSDAAARAQRGKQARKAAARSSLADFDPELRADPVEVLEQAGVDRVGQLIAVRHRRMLESPYAYFRGATAVMARDLARSQVTGIDVQLCGDAHLSNFGAFASSERRLRFDPVDVDDTIRGPWEWDLKRLVASVEVAARQRDFSKRHRRALTLTTTRHYRLAMRGFARMSNLEVWHSRLPMSDILDAVKERRSKSTRKRVTRTMAKSPTRETLTPLHNLTAVADGRRVIVDSPPMVVRPAEDRLGPELAQTILTGLADTMPEDRHDLLSSYELADIAELVVGVSGVGVSRWTFLLTGKDNSDLLFLNVTEPKSSALGVLVPEDSHPNPAARVVAGQRLLASGGDLFGGWTAATGFDGAERYFAVRHLRDQRGSADIEAMTEEGMAAYARACAWTLARAHARSGDRIAIATYIGNSDAVDRALGGFAVAYADQNERDFAAFAAAVESARLSVADTR